MSPLTLVALFWLVFSSLWLCHFFVILFLYGYYFVREPNQYMAGFEVILTLSLAALGIERIIRIRERK